MDGGGGGKGGRLSVAPGWSGETGGLTGQNRVSGVRTLRKIISVRLEETAHSFFWLLKISPRLSQRVDNTFTHTNTHTHILIHTYK